MIGIKFTDCDLDPKDPRIADKISGHKTGIVLLRILEEINGYGPQNKHVFKIYYVLANVFQSATGLMCEACGRFIWDVKGKITGYNQLGLQEQVYEALDENEIVETHEPEHVIVKI